MFFSGKGPPKQGRTSMDSGPSRAPKGTAGSQHGKKIVGCKWGHPRPVLEALVGALEQIPEDLTGGLLPSQ